MLAERVIPQPFHCRDHLSSPSDRQSMFKPFWINTLTGDLPDKIGSRRSTLSNTAFSASKLLNREAPHYLAMHGRWGSYDSYSCDKQ